MNQLTIKELKAVLANVDDDTKIYLGDDEELNGIHEAYFAQLDDGSLTEGFIETEEKVFVIS